VVVDESYRRDMVVVFYLGFYHYKLQVRTWYLEFVVMEPSDSRSTANWTEDPQYPETGMKRFVNVILGAAWQ
jgi:hypothetical protein